MILVEHLDLDSLSCCVILGLAFMIVITCQVFVFRVMMLVVIVISIPLTNCPLLVVYFFRCTTRKWLLVGLTNFLLHLRRDVAVNWLAFRGWF
jgi:hypothetical protein